MTLPEAIGAEIRAEAAARRITLKELATHAGVSRSALYNWLDANRAMPIQSLYAIADVLHIRGSELLRRAEDRARTTHP